MRNGIENFTQSISASTVSEFLDFPHAVLLRAAEEVGVTREDLAEAIFAAQITLDTLTSSRLSLDKPLGDSDSEAFTLLSVLADSGNVETEVIVTLEAEEIQRTMDNSGLTAEERIAWEMKREGAAYKDIASKIGASDNVVRTKINIAQRKINHAIHANQKLTQ